VIIDAADAAARCEEAALDAVWTAALFAEDEEADVEVAAAFAALDDALRRNLILNVSLRSNVCDKSSRW